MKAAVGHAAGYRQGLAGAGGVYAKLGLGNCVNPLFHWRIVPYTGSPWSRWSDGVGSRAKRMNPSMPMERSSSPCSGRHPICHLEAGSADVQIEMKEQAVQESGPVALVIRKGLFQPLGAE